MSRGLYFRERRTNPKRMRPRENVVHIAPEPEAEDDDHRGQGALETISLPTVGGKTYAYQHRSAWGRGVLMVGGKPR